MTQSNASLNQYDDLRKEVAQRYEQLHPDLKAALVSVDTAGAVYEIAKKFGLNIEKTGYLADVIGYTIIGLLPVADFINNLKDTLGIDGAKAEEIAREVNAKIFLAIREQLKKTHGEKWDERGFHEQARTATTNSREQQSEQPRTAPTPQTPTTPKSPWEIRPDGFDRGKPVAETKSVIPPTPVLSIKDQVLRTETAKAAEAEVKKAVLVPPELPKTREAPQPTQITKGVEVLKEIRPAGASGELGIRNKEIGITEAPKATPPIGLPIMKEAEKLMQTPELSKPTTDNLQQITPPQPKQTTNNQQPTTPTMPKATPPAVLPIQQPTTYNKQLTTPPTKPTTDNKQPITPPTSTQKYTADPYREPIE